MKRLIEKGRMQEKRQVERIEEECEKKINGEDRRRMREGRKNAKRQMEKKEGRGESAASEERDSLRAPNRDGSRRERRPTASWRPETECGVAHTGLCFRIMLSMGITYASVLPVPVPDFTNTSFPCAARAGAGEQRKAGVAHESAMRHEQNVMVREGHPSDRGGGRGQGRGEKAKGAVGGEGRGGEGRCRWAGATPSAPPGSLPAGPSWARGTCWWSGTL